RRAPAFRGRHVGRRRFRPRARARARAFAARVVEHSTRARRACTDVPHGRPRLRSRSHRPAAGETIMIFLLAACGSDLVHDNLNVRTDDAVLPVDIHGNMDSGTLLLVESGGPSGPSIAQRTVGYMPFQDTLEPELAVAFYDRRGTGNATG